MKSRYAVSLVMLAALVAVLSQKVIAGRGESGGQNGTGGIPLFVGQYSTTVQGSLAICLDLTTFAEESCSTAGSVAFPLSVLTNGVNTGDKDGNNCSSITEVDSNLPVDASPPIVTANEHTVSKVLNYDSTTGTGDGSFITYIGGTCTGATFDNTGATELSSGTDHFVVTENGNRVDFLITKATSPTGSVGDFSLSGVNLRQTR